MTCEEIIRKLAEAFPKAYRTPDPADESCMTVFTDADGQRSIRPLTYGEIADVLAEGEVHV